MAALIFPPLVASLAAAFAGPLIGACRWQNLHLHLYGGNARRRLLALCVTGSAAGLDPDPVQDELATGSGRLLSDTVLLVNEPALCSASSTTSGNPAEKVTNLAPRWRGVVVSAGAGSHKPLRGANRVLGYLVEPPLNLPVSDAAWRRSRRKGADNTSFLWALKSYAPRSSDTFQKYIQFVEGCRGERLEEITGSHISKFRALVKKADPEVANCLLITGTARLYAAGMMAITAGVLPLNPSELDNALLACLMVARGSAGYNTVTVLGLQRRMRGRLQSGNIVGAGKDKPASPRDHDGFWHIDGSDRVYTVCTKTFNSWFPNRAERIALLLWLHKTGQLRIAEHALRPSLTSTAWAKRCPRWPDGRTYRSYVFREPSKHRARREAMN